jgi:hypothetical protein
MLFRHIVFRQIFFATLRQLSFADDAIDAAIDTPLRHYCLLRRQPATMPLFALRHFIISAISSCRFRHAAIASHFRLLTYFHLMMRFSCLLAAAAIDSCFAAMLLPARRRAATLLLMLTPPLPPCCLYYAFAFIACAPARCADMPL